MLSDHDLRLLRAWRKGQLSEPLRMAFELRLFAEPDLLSAAELDLAIEASLPTLPLPASPPPTGTARVAYAASLLLLVLLVIELLWSRGGGLALWLAQGACAVTVLASTLRMCWVTSRHRTRFLIPPRLGDRSP